MSNAQNPVWLTILLAIITALGLWGAQAWASRGKKLTDINAMAVDNADTAMKMAKEALDRVSRVENESGWLRSVVEMKDRYIVVLLAHIHQGNPPPPPPEPIYPPRPA